MTKEEGKFLQERAKKFLKNANELLEEKVFDLAAFNFEQGAQLILKYNIFLLLGDYPKTHSLRTLFSVLIEASEQKKKNVERFFHDNIDIIANLENAYLTSRYLPAEFVELEVENMAEFVKELFRFLET